MTSLRDDARRALGARRARNFATPAPLAAPIVSTVVLAAITTVVLVVTGVGTGVLLAALGAIAVAAFVAAHRTTAGFFAGLALWTIRPYRPGERVRLDAPEHGGSVEAEVLRIGLINTTLHADAGLLVVANTRMLRAAR